MILAIVQPALSFQWKETIAIPIVSRLARSFRALQIKWHGPIKGHDSHAVLDGLDTHLPISRARDGVKVPVIDERLELHLQRTASLHQLVLHIRGVRALRHPNTLFQPGVAEGIGPYRRCIFQTKLLNMLKSLWFDRATR